MQTLSVNLDEGLISIGSASRRLRGKWDQTFLACLARNGVMDAGLLHDDLRRQGLARELAPAELARLVDRLNGVLADLSSGLPQRLRIAHGPRAKTCGPWQINGGHVEMRIVGDSHTGSTLLELTRSFALTAGDSADPASASRLANSMKLAT